MTADTGEQSQFTCITKGRYKHLLDTSFGMQTGWGLIRRLPQFLSEVRDSMSALEMGKLKPRRSSSRTQRGGSSPAPVVSNPVVLKPAASTCPLLPPSLLLSSPQEHNEISAVLSSIYR